MSREQCSRCLFWRVEQGKGDLREESFGWCRRNPPSIVDQMARQAIPPVGFGGNNCDPEDVADVVNVQRSGLFPATFANAWCGEFKEQVVADVARAASEGDHDWTRALAEYTQLRAASDALRDCDPREDEALSPYNAAMDNLVENVRAPSPRALAIKLELARDRWEGFSLPNSWFDAFVADLKHIGGEA
jgi:hypothetical protein